MESSSNESAMMHESQVDFDFIRLHMGVPVQVERLESAGHKFNVRYVGAIKGKSIILTLPSENGGGIQVQPGQSYVIRGFDGKYAYAFTSRALQTRLSPFPYAHFSYPEKVEYKVVRKALRIMVHLPAEVVRDNEPTHVTMLDLSENGSMLDAPKSIGDVSGKVVIQFDIVIGGSKSRLKLPARIRNARPKDAENLQVGIEFEDIPREEMLMLDNFILHHSIDLDSLTEA